MSSAYNIGNDISLTMFVSIPQNPYFVARFNDVMLALKLEKMCGKDILVSVPQWRGSVRAAEPGFDFSTVPRHYWKELFLYSDGQGQPWDIRDDQVVTSSTPLQLLQCSDCYQNWNLRKTTSNRRPVKRLSSVIIALNQKLSAKMLNYNYIIYEFSPKRDRKFYNVVFKYVCMYVCMYVCIYIYIYIHTYVYM